MNRKNRRARPPRRLYLLGGGTEISLVLASGLCRLLDRVLHTRLSVYGWAFYFGNVAGEIDCTTWTNVCVRCGSGHPARALDHGRLFYRCPDCGARNVFTRDAATS